MSSVASALSRHCPESRLLRVTIAQSRECPASRVPRVTIAQSHECPESRLRAPALSILQGPARLVKREPHVGEHDDHIELFHGFSDFTALSKEASTRADCTLLTQSGLAALRPPTSMPHLSVPYESVPYVSMQGHKSPAALPVCILCSLPFFPPAFFAKQYGQHVLSPAGLCRAVRGAQGRRA